MDFGSHRLHLGYDFGHVVGELVDAAAHGFEEGRLAGEIDTPSEVTADDGREHILHFFLDSNFLRSVGPLDDRSDALAAVAQDRARNSTEGARTEHALVFF